MNRKLYWGFGALILLIVGAFSFVIYQQYQDIAELEAEGKADLERLEKQKQGEDNPPTAAPGYKIVQHGDHFHEVPIDAPDLPIKRNSTPAQEQQMVTVTEEVIYPHKELLNTHPVAALRALAKDSGHWSAKYIAPFPPEDVEANELARAYYIDNYHSTRGNLNHPAAVKARNYISKWQHDSGYWKDISGPRHHDLARLGWIGHESSVFDDEFLEFFDKRLSFFTTFTKEEYENAYNNN